MKSSHTWGQIDMKNSKQLCVVKWRVCNKLSGCAGTIGVCAIIDALVVLLMCWYYYWCVGTIIDALVLLLMCWYYYWGCWYYYWRVDTITDVLVQLLTCWYNYWRVGTIVDLLQLDSYYGWYMESKQSVNIRQFTSPYNFFCEQWTRLSWQ